MIEQIQVGDTSVEVEFKDIKNIHLSVHPPTGRVRIAAPDRMDMDAIRIYAISKVDWIKKHQQVYQEQERETPREFLDLESHYVWGQRYLLAIREESRSPSVELKHSDLILTVRPGSSLEKRKAVLAAWYRDEIRRVAEPLIKKWETTLDVKVNQCFVQQMKTRWGSCNPTRRNIRLNTELAKKPLACLEYILVHEMVHLLAPTHNEKFLSLMDSFLPHWRHIREELNRAPLGHVEWDY